LVKNGSFSAEVMCREGFSSLQHGDKKQVVHFQSTYEVDDVFPCSLILAEKWLQSQLLGIGDSKYLEFISFEYFLHIIFVSFFYHEGHAA